MSYKVDNAIIMAAGISSRFAPLSYEKPKALLTVRGEVLLERQIRQLLAAGIADIILVIGYKKEQFAYLAPKYGVKLIENRQYATHNNSSSIYAARQHLKNTYICSADNYFTSSPFAREVEQSYYAALYAKGTTAEWCLQIDQSDRIRQVNIGGSDCWYMLGHCFWSEDFSSTFKTILLAEYDKPATKNKYWENLFIDHLEQLPMQIKRYKPEDIFEFDSLDELRLFDPVYCTCSGSAILADISSRLGWPEANLQAFFPEKNAAGQVTGFTFSSPDGHFLYNYASAGLTRLAAGT